MSGPEIPSRRRRAWRQVRGALVLSTIGSGGFVVAYWAELGPHAEGLSLSVALAGLAMAAGVYGRHVLPERTDEEPRATMASSTREREGVARAADVDDGATPPGRRGVLGLLTLALGGLGAALASPLRSFGPSPLPERSSTSWRAGRRLVDESGVPVRLGDLEVGSIVTAFAEGDEHRSDSQVVLIRMRGTELDPARARTDWAPEGHIAYSKICTHAGCPVGLYEPGTKELFCPCHQSVFLADEGARPTFGPASRALPQLPLGVENGHFVALGDFPEPIGPSYWSRP